jgi:DNA-binding NarL/FixJ family response regulator
MNLDAATHEQPSPDSYQLIREILERAVTETLSKVAGPGMEHLLLQALRERREPPRISAPPLPTRRLPLSERQHQVLRLVATGASNKEIARSLNLSLHTIKRHVANILNKLGVDSRLEAAAVLYAHH